MLECCQELFYTYRVAMCMLLAWLLCLMNDYHNGTDRDYFRFPFLKISNGTHIDASVCPFLFKISMKSSDEMQGLKYRTPNRTQARFYLHQINQTTTYYVYHTNYQRHLQF